MTRKISCSHCLRNGHGKRSCPHKATNADEVRRATMKETSERLAAIDKVARAIAEFPVDERAKLTCIAFEHATGEASSAKLRAMWAADSADNAAVALALGVVRS